MQLVDKWAGGMIVALLSLLDVWKGRLAVGVTPCWIAVAKYFGMGSIVLAIPTLHALKRQFPGASIIFVSFANHGDFLKLVHCIDDVILIRNHGLLPMVWDTIRAVWRLRALMVDTYLDLEFFSRYSAILARLSGARQRVGFHTLSLRQRGRLFTHRVHLNPYRHISENFKLLAQALTSPQDPGDRIFKGAIGETAGLGMVSDIAEKDFRLLPLPPSAHEEAQMVLAQIGLGKTYVVINPNASDTARDVKLWPASSWQALIRNLAIVLPAETHICFVGSREERAFVQGLFEGLNPEIRVYNLAGRLSIAGLAALLAGARVVISLDSGPAHLSWVLDTPTVMLFGPETPTLYGPLSARSRVISHRLPCSPCLNILEGKRTDCRNNRCMSEITVPEVVAEVIDLLRGEANGPLGGMSGEGN
jgi:ADP-heptose:LPS heptosyltransferase